MKRLEAVVAVVALAMALFSFGCEQKKQAPPAEQTPPPPPPQYPQSQIPAAEQPAPTPPVSAQPAETPTAEKPIATIDEESAPAAPKASKSKSKAKPAKDYAPKSAAGGKSYVVRNGDTLQEISQKYYGTSKKWRKIYDANKSKIKDPNKLVVGTKLVIP
jgi:nucleoid-associated protein YgaU